MNVTGQPALRPLRLGEMLDRAVTLCVKFFVPLSVIWLVFAIPLAVVGYFANQGLQAMLQAITDATQQNAAAGAASNGAAIARALANGGGFNGWSLALIVMTLLVGPLPTAALIEAASSTYFGRLPNFVDAYRVALARWLPLIGLNVLYVVACALLYLAVVLVTVILFLALAFLTSALHALGIALDAFVAIVVACCGVAFAMVAVLALQVSYFTCVVERANAAVAFTSGISRVFVGSGLKRSLVVGAAYFAIGIGILIVSFAGQALFVGVLHSALAGAAYATIVQVATAAFTTMFVCIFYVDLRVREEGLDLTLAARSAR